MDVSPLLWQQLLALREASKCADPDTVGVTLADGQFRFASSTQELYEYCDNTVTAVVSIKPLQLPGFECYQMLQEGLEIHCRASIDSVIHQIFKLYLPLCTVPIHSRYKTFVVAHAAQSLDGKVCTGSGASKWIGNEQNLIHAHRVRALVDGVLVGGNTVRNEDPNLTVRHVSGPNPVRLFLCNHLTATNKSTLVQCGPTLIISSAQHKPDMDERFSHQSNIKTLAYPTQNGRLAVSSLLTVLFEQGVRSLMVEGGPTTMSTLLQARKIDWLQLHIAPMVFGSGKSFADLEVISEVKQASQLNGVFYTPMGDAMMITGQIRCN